MTATEVFRQLQRLSEVSLVQRQPDGTFTITQYGQLVLHLSSSYEFISNHIEYFLNHDLWRIPTQFVDRIGALSKTSLRMDTVESINRSIQIFLEADEYTWGISERGVGPDHLDPAINEQIRKGVDFKLIIPEDVLSSAISQISDKNMEVRGLPDIPAIIVMSEKEAAVFFPFIGGRMDYAGFFGKDPAFVDWAKDLFLYYWSKGKRV